MTADPLFLPGERLPASKLNDLSPDPVAFTPIWTNVTVSTPDQTYRAYTPKGALAMPSQ